MTVERIECASDPRAAAYRDLGDGELLRRRGVFVAEGRLVVRRLIEDARYTIESLLLNESARRDLEPAIGRLDSAVPVLVCRTDTFAQLTGYNIHFSESRLKCEECPEGVYRASYSFSKGGDWEVDFNVRLRDGKTVGVDFPLKVKP